MGGPAPAQASPNTADIRNRGTLPGLPAGVMGAARGIHRTWERERPVILSRGARLCESIIRHARTKRGGIRECGRPYLARRLGCSPRTVSRYVAELRAAGRLEVTPPRRRRTRNGWRSVGVNGYRLPRPAHPAPHVQTRRSRRGDTHGTPSPNGDRVDRGSPPIPGHDPADRVDPGAAIALLLERIRT